MATLYTINPSRRKKRHGGKKRRTAKQRAATRRMLAARFGSNPKKRRSKRRASKRTVSRRTVRVSRRSRRSGRRRSRGIMRGFNTGNAVNLLKSGAIGGAGAVLVDIGMGQAARMLPAAFATPTDSAGNVQYGYFGAKAALAIALGTFGGRIMPPAVAEKMGEGALTVLAYQFIRPLVPAGLALGYFNPAPTMRPTIKGTGAYVQGAGAYTSIPVRNSGNGNGAMARGGRAANVLSMVNLPRRAA